MKKKTQTQQSSSGHVPTYYRYYSNYYTEKFLFNMLSLLTELNSHDLVIPLRKFFYVINNKYAA